jgi:hypothetical protein
MIQQDSVAIEATRNNPCVVLEVGTICIRGRAISENPGEFFRPLLEWISSYIINPCTNTEIELGFEYINTSSIKWIHAILKEISRIKNSYSSVKVIWNYERDDEDMFELGLIFRSEINCQFILIQVDRISNKP